MIVSPPAAPCAARVPTFHPLQGTPLSAWISHCSGWREGEQLPEKEPFNSPPGCQGGQAPSTQAGRFVREEMDHIRGGKTRRPVGEAGHCNQGFQRPGGWAGAAEQGRL
jgi:hypothetical protein